MPDKNRQVIEGLEREWRDALCSKDMEKLQSLVHPDFVLIGTRSTGPFMMGRDEWLDAIQRRD
ncbi:MAG TPA: nuclear transport factor 2 family protein, partial [Sphingomicrobium sp.]|nr:nuclear transport factor 2 family protein [Sphingomicrobium sp.]